MTGLAIRFGTLHDGLGEPKSGGTLIVADGRVAALGGPELPVPGGTRIVEAACVVPGLVNAHVHLEMGGEPRTAELFVLTTPTQRAFLCAEHATQTVRAGVTTVRDLGSSGALAIELRDAIAEGRLPGPAIVPAGKVICMTGGHGGFVGRETDGVADAVLAVREQRRAGASCIKLIATGGVLTRGAVPGLAQLREDEMRAAVDEAHRHGMRVAAHAIGAAGIANALRAGVDSIEHGHLIDDAGIALARERDVPIVPTLSAIRCIVDADEGAGMPAFVLDKARAIAADAEANLRRARAAGVRFAGGSDAGTPFNGHGEYVRELELMVEMLGMTPGEALATATREAARLLGVGTGTLGVGDAADLIVVAGDVTADVRVLRTPQIVVRSGEILFER